MLRTLLECLGKSDERREERDQSGSRAVVYRSFCVRRLSNYVIASYNVKEAEGPSCVVGDGALPDRVVFSICGCVLRGCWTVAGVERRVERTQERAPRPRYRKSIC